MTQEPARAPLSEDAQASGRAAPSPPIRELPDELISQIAAGEVVERPASVVRELVDNALDAGASQITVRLLAGGVRQIAWWKTTAAAFRRRAAPGAAPPRHQQDPLLHDLESVGTMGFRGEALAAIASVSELSMPAARRTPPMPTGWTPAAAS
jgi:DNA mismatch repair protein MutL